MKTKKIAVLTAALTAASMLQCVPAVSAEPFSDPDDLTVVQQVINSDPELPFDDAELLNSCRTSTGEDQIFSSEDCSLGPKTILNVSLRSSGEFLWRSTEDMDSEYLYDESYTSGLCSVGDKETALEMYEAMLDDNPHLFFLPYKPTFENDYIYVYIPSQYMPIEARREAKQQMNDYLTSTVAELEKNDTTYGKIAALHDKIIDDTEYEEVTGENDTCSVMNVINGGKASSEAYARSFNLILNYMHIENYVISGKLSSGERHYWNLVKLDDENYYYVDCAADDAEGTDKYLFVGSDSMADRTLNSPDKKGEDHSLKLPEASRKDYDKSVKTRTLPEGFNDKEFIKRCSKRYGYDFIGTLQNGKRYQALYNSIYDTALEWWYRTDNLKPSYVSFDMERFGIYNYDDVRNVLMYFLYDNPQFFYISDSISMPDGAVHIRMYSDYAYADYRQNAKIDMINYVLEVAPEIEKFDTDYEKVLYYHDKLVEDCVYNTEQMTRPSCHNVIGAMIDGLTVCEGYAHAFDMMMNYVGVESLFAIAPMHAWNMVKLDDGKYYYLDVTADDSSDSKVYFCVGKENFLKGAGEHHTPFTSDPGQFASLYDLPEGSDTDFDPSILAMLKNSSSEADESESSKADDRDSSKSNGPESSNTDDHDSSKPDKKRDLGDVNNDSTIDIEDAVLVINHVNGNKALTDEQIGRADIDKNNNIDIEDAVRIIGYVNGVSVF